MDSAKSSLDSNFRTNNRQLFCAQCKARKPYHVFRHRGLCRKVCAIYGES